MRVFLPKRFTDIFSDGDIDINNETHILKLIYHGISNKSDAYLLCPEILTL
jgi:hypothetical protein